jgi:uncharacterized protein (TIGR03790 family)
MLAALLLAAAIQERPDEGARVLVLVNRNSRASREIADDYCLKRKLEKRLEVACPDAALDAEHETIAYALFAEAIEKPLRAALAAHPEVDFVVLTKGLPIRIRDAPGLGVDGRQPSVDSWIAALGYEQRADTIRLTLRDGKFSGQAFANRFWNSAKPFSQREFGGHLVTRLDGYSVADAEALVAHALEAESNRPHAAFLLDACASFGFGDRAAQPVCLAKDARVVAELSYGDFNADMAAAAVLLEKHGRRVRFEKTDEFAGGTDELSGYVSWGSNDKRFDARKYHELRFAPGGIAETAVSTSARTFLPTEGGQSLIADLVHQGATGAKGYCDEPLLQAISSPSVLFERYSRGWTLAESFYAAARFVGWEDIVLGDPLCRPYRE